MRLFQLGLIAAITLTSAAASWAAQVTTDERQPAYRRTSDSEAIAPYRRAYRAACTKYQPAEYCECIAAGFAQSLNPGELALARMKLAYDHARSDRARASSMRALNRAGPGLGFATADDRRDEFTHIDNVEADLQSTCGKP